LPLEIQGTLNLEAISDSIEEEVFKGRRKRILGNEKERIADNGF